MENYSISINISMTPAFGPFPSRRMLTAEWTLLKLYRVHTWISVSCYLVSNTKLKPMIEQHSEYPVSVELKSLDFP